MRRVMAKEEYDNATFTFIGMGVLSFIVSVCTGFSFWAQWQTFLLGDHAVNFGSKDPYFHLDYSFFVFHLPVIDIWVGLGFTLAIFLLVLVAIATTALLYSNDSVGTDGTRAQRRSSYDNYYDKYSDEKEDKTKKEKVPAKKKVQPVGVTAGDWQGALRFSRMTVAIGVSLGLLLAMCAVGAYFGQFHQAQEAHGNFVGVDASTRNVWMTLNTLWVWFMAILAVFTLGLGIFWTRRPVALLWWSGISVPSTAILVLVLLLIVPGVYNSVSVSPNELAAQTPALTNYLQASQYAWGLTPTQVQSAQFGNPQSLTVSDLQADPETLSNARIQDYRELPDVLEQLQKSRSYQDFPDVTIDRYTLANGQQEEVMLADREISESNLPNQNFNSSALIYTHGYGVATVSVSQVGNEGEPDVLVGNQPEAVLSNQAPPQFSGITDPRIYCGLSTSQPVIVNTTQNEFDYPSGTGDHTSHAGAGMVGSAVPQGLDQLALSVNQFGSPFSIGQSSAITSQSVVLLHRAIVDRLNSLAPFLTVDGTPWLVADPESGHFVWMVNLDATSSNFPEAYTNSNGNNYMRQVAVATIDAKTCATTIYTINPKEPFTADYMATYPGLFTPLSNMPADLSSHMEYPTSLFASQSDAWSQVHVPTAAILYNQSNVYRRSQENVNGNLQDMEAYYVEMVPPGQTKDQFELLQTFSPGVSGGGTANNMLTAELLAGNDYSNGMPQLTSIALNNQENVLGPLQFDNNINTNTTISSQITLLDQHGSTVTLGNVIVLPFNNDSFLYVRPMYVEAQNGSFPQLKYVIVGTQNTVAEGTSLNDALNNLFNVTTTLPPATPGASNSSPPSSTGLSAQVEAIINGMLADEASYQSDVGTGNFTAAGVEQQAISTYLTQLQALVGSSATVVATASPSAVASPVTSPLATPSPSPSP